MIKRQVVKWGGVGVLAAVGALSWIVLTLTLRASLWGFSSTLPGFIFPAWPLLQLSAGAGFASLLIPTLCLLSNFVLYAFVSYIWYGPGSRRTNLRVFVRIGILMWFIYSVLLPVLQRQINLMR